MTPLTPAQKLALQLSPAVAQRARLAFALTRGGGAGGTTASFNAASAAAVQATAASEEQRRLKLVAGGAVIPTISHLPLYDTYIAGLESGAFYEVGKPPAGSYVKPRNTPLLDSIADYNALKSGAVILSVMPSINQQLSGFQFPVVWQRPAVLHRTYEAAWLAEALPAYRNMTDINAINADIAARMKSNATATGGFLFDTVVPLVVVSMLAYGFSQLAAAALTTPPVVPANAGTTGLVDATSGAIAPPPAVTVSPLPTDILSFPAPQSTSSIIDAATAPINLSYLSTPLDAQIAAQTAQSAALLAPINTGNAMLTGLGLTSTATTADLLTALTPADMGTILGGTGATSWTDSIQKALPSQDKVAAAVKAAVAAGVAGSVKKAPAPVAASNSNFWLYALGAGALLFAIKK